MIKEKDVLELIKGAENCFILTENGLNVKGSPVVIARHTMLKMIQDKEFRKYMKIYLNELKQFINAFKEELQEKLEENDNDNE